MLHFIDCRITNITIFANRKQQNVIVRNATETNCKRHIKKE